MSAGTPRGSQQGFTLLEVLVAMALLSIALLTMSRIQSNNIVLSQYEQQQITAATLAKWKMVDVQLDLEKNGLGDDEKEKCGKFDEDLDDKAFSGWEWCWTLKKVDLPLPMDMLGGNKQGGGDGDAGDAISAGMQHDQGGGAQGLPGGLDPKAAGEALSKAVRVLKLQVKWKLGSTPQELDVTTHVVNFSQVGLP